MIMIVSFGCDVGGKLDYKRTNILPCRIYVLFDFIIRKHVIKLNQNASSTLASLYYIVKLIHMRSVHLGS